MKNIRHFLEQDTARLQGSFLRREYPQVLAVALTYCEDLDEVLSVFPKRLKADILMRMHYIEPVSVDAVSLLDGIFEDRVVGRA
ncbi:MAG: hypothetical protein HOC52_15010 [Thiotrichales bacterium]|jgi:flagellar motor switch protein FliG|nr:hypothetical protein [Thiotrichales bacterium]